MALHQNKMYNLKRPGEKFNEGWMAGSLNFYLQFFSFYFFVCQFQVSNESVYKIQFLNYG